MLLITYFENFKTKGIEKHWVQAPLNLTKYPKFTSYYEKVVKLHSCKTQLSQQEKAQVNYDWEMNMRLLAAFDGH